MRCSGWWELKKSGKQRLEFTEHITVNNGCDDGVKVIVTMFDSKNIGVAWFIPALFGDKAIAAAVLYKKGFEPGN